MKGRSTLSFLPSLKNTIRLLKGQTSVAYYPDSVSTPSTADALFIILALEQMFNIASIWTDQYMLK